ncbi:MAG: sulfur carrier protein ThiS [Phycisphaeraceae bacterium]|nr:sulfur carrier protein ThiS [Phycisphaeraceae bacterium]
MKIIVNGREEDVAPGTTVRELIERLDLARAACAAEVNKRLVPRREHESRTLSEGDVIELVSLVGGG